MGYVSFREGIISALDGGYNSLLPPKKLEKLLPLDHWFWSKASFLCVFFSHFWITI